MTTVGEVRTQDAIQEMNRKMPEFGLRDLFAMNALSLLSGGSWNGTPFSWLRKEEGFQDEIADTCYKVADAMMARRKIRG